MPPIETLLQQYPGKIINGKAVAEKVHAQVKESVAALKAERNLVPKLVVVRVGEDPASKVYVEKKAKTARELGIEDEVIVFPEDASEESVLATIDRLNFDPSVHAVLIQLPLPKHLDAHGILSRLSPAKDVDGFHPINLGLLLEGQLMPIALPCTPAGMMTMLDEHQVEISGKHAVVVGRSTIVGKPIAHLLLQRHATVTICHSRTKNLGEILKQADIVIAAVGVPELIKGEDLKPGCVVLDVGINRVVPPGSEKAKLVGDVHFVSAVEKARLISPVPGGVGPMTVATLMQNTVKLCQAGLDLIHSDDTCCPV